jgi:hypothetical protein
MQRPYAMAELGWSSAHDVDQGEPGTVATNDDTPSEGP